MRLSVLLIFSLLSAGEWRPLEVRATAYCPCKVCCGIRAAGITSDGTDVREWPYGVAVVPELIRYGTPILIPVGNGYLDNQSPQERVFYADDTGGIIRRKTATTGKPHIDLRFVRHASAVKFGVKNITIYIWVD